MEKKLFLLDGHALVFRMYYALLQRPMVNSRGEDTSILFGFTKYLMELLEKEKPSHFAVAFDPPGKTFRHQLFPEYKGTRAATPQAVIDALEPLCDLCRALRIPVLMVPGFEADDVIGTVAGKAASAGFDVYMVTPDKDYGQLVAPHVFQYKPGRKGSDHEVLDEAGVAARYGIPSPAQVVDMLTICGDASDNVPGVKGVGEVGAAKLISKYGGVDGIYAHLDELSPRQRGMFEEVRDHIGLSRTLVTIRRDVPVGENFEDMAVKAPYRSILDFCDRYEFPSLKRRFTTFSGDGGDSAAYAFQPAAGKTAPEITRPDSATGHTPENLSANANKRRKPSWTEVPVSKIETLARQEGCLALCWDEAATSVATAPIRELCLGLGEKVCRTTPGAVSALLSNPSIAKCGYRLKEICR